MKSASARHGYTIKSPSFSSAPILQRATLNKHPASDVPMSVYQTLHASGRPLDSLTRSAMESRFGHDFSSVQVHTDNQAAASASEIQARAYAVGQHVVFGSGQYAPASRKGQRLLAHELTHVVQQSPGVARTRTEAPLHLGNPGSAAEQEARRTSDRLDTGRMAEPTFSAEPGTVQRDGDTAPDSSSSTTSPSSSDSDDSYRLRWPAGPARPRLLPDLQLHLDPEIQAQINAMRIVREALDPAGVRAAVLSISSSSLFTSPAPRPAWLSGPATPTPAPLVPRGAGPDTPRAASAGDAISAIMAIPAVDSALTTLRTEAADRARQDWRRLGTPGQVLLISQSAIIAGGALAGVFANPSSRDFALGLIQNRDIPVPGVSGLTFQFNATGPERMLRFDLNVGALLPPSLGFH